MSNMWYYYKKMIKFFNSKTRKKESFEPLQEVVGLYTCGPTVYDFSHIGNLRAYIFEDVLKRTLIYNEYKVKHVMNITDVGHLVSDDDIGEDKMEKSAKEKKKSAYDIAQFYTEAFINDIKKLNIILPDVLVKATETIEEQIELIKLMEEKGFTYKTTDGIYFDTSKLPSYGKMANITDIQEGIRVLMKEKKNPTDFAVWKFSEPDSKREMEWESPWGIGFPGWHTECVAMSKMHLGIPFDIHCGGIDHIEIHHPNEIAQSEAAYETDLANFWMHSEFLDINKEKMSKSKGNFYKLSDIEDYSPLSYRYLCLNSHYRSKISFSKEALQGAKNSLKNLQNKVASLDTQKGEILEKYKTLFLSQINDDLNTSKALDTLWTLLKDKKVEEKDKRETVLDFDKVLGLSLEIKEKASEEHTEDSQLPEEIKKMAKERFNLRKKGEFEEADRLRDILLKKGYKIEDIKNSYIIKKNG